MATDQPTKICVRCKIEKPLDQFVKGKQRRDGRTNRCLECERKRGQARYDSDCRHDRYLGARGGKKERAELPLDRKCKTCAQTKPLSGFPQHKEYLGGRTYQCTACHSAKSLAIYHRLVNDPVIGEADLKRRAAHARRSFRKRRQAALKIAKAWKEAHREQCNAHSRNRHARKRAAEGHHTAEDIARILAAQNDRCAICSCALFDKKYEVDHIMPLSLGGSNWPRNLQITCEACNRSKHNADPLDFMRRLGRLL